MRRGAARARGQRGGGADARMRSKSKRTVGSRPIENVSI